MEPGFYETPDYKTFFSGGPPEEDLDELVAAFEAAADRRGLEQVTDAWRPYTFDMYTARFEDGDEWIELRYYGINYHHYEIRVGGGSAVRDTLSDAVQQDIPRRGVIGAFRDRVNVLRDRYQQL